MAIPLTQSAQDALDAGKLIPATLIDFYCADIILHGWSWPGELVFEGVQYESLYERITITKRVKTSATLASSPMTIALDASRARDDTDIIGKFIDADYHQSKIRVRTVQLNLNTDPITIDGVLDEYNGRMDVRPINHAPNQEHIIELRCEGGIFRLRGRNMRARTHEDQQIRAPGDRFFEHTPRRVVENPYWGVKPENMPANADFQTGSAGGRGIRPGKHRAN